MTQPYRLDSGPAGDDDRSFLVGDDDDYDLIDDGTAADIDAMMRDAAARILWEVVWGILDPSGEITKEILAMVIDRCRESMQISADASIISSDPEVVHEIRQCIDRDIREGAKSFLQAYMSPMVNPKVTADIVERLRKRLTDVEPPAE